MPIPFVQLRAYPLFSNLSDDELTALTPSITRRVFGKGAYLYYPGNPGVNVYLVETGLVRLFFNDLHGREHLLDLLGPRAMAGFPMLHESQMRMAGAVALLPTTALVLPQENLAQFVEHSPRLMKNIYFGMDAALRKLLSHLQTQVSLSMNGRLAKLLLYLNELGGTNNEIDLPLTQADLAIWINASRGHFNRALSHLQKAGLIRLEGQKIILLNVPGLQQMSVEQVPESV